MSGTFSYKGKVLGHIHSYMDGSIARFIIGMESIETLEHLCRLSEDEIIEINGTSFFYEQFKKQILSRTKMINLSPH